MPIGLKELKGCHELTQGVYAHRGVGKTISFYYCIIYSLKARSVIYRSEELKAKQVLERPGSQQIFLNPY